MSGSGSGLYDRHEYWGQAWEAMLPAVSSTVEHLNLLLLICMMYPENKASVRVAENMGMTFEKEMVDEKGPYWIYAKNR
jgi:RimJ/RimL family protein N-acetyltransferase